MIPEEDFILPDENGFKGNTLDFLLAAGYYRMQHCVFTTCFTQIDILKAPIPVFWLRTPVKKIIENSKVATIRRNCAAFTTTYKNAEVNIEVEELYQIYRSHISFDASDSCRSYLHDRYFPNPFQSQMIEVRDGDTLIAVGYFDQGTNALAGILNFYHPAYKKYSLGKYLMLQKIDFALAKGIQFYYTGYISTAITKFDYKIFPDANAMEVFLPVEQIWVSYKDIGKEGLQVYVNNSLQYFLS